MVFFVPGKDMSSFTDVIQDLRVTVRRVDSFFSFRSRDIWVRRLGLAQVTVYNSDNVGSL